MPRPLKLGTLGTSTIILSKDIDKYAFMCGSNFNETDVTLHNFKPQLLILFKDFFYKDTTFRSCSE